MTKRTNEPAQGAQGFSAPIAKPAPSGDAVQPTPPRHLALVDDEKALHLSVRLLLRSHAPHWTLHSFSDADAALAGIPHLRPAPHVVLMDIRMPTRSGLDCVRSLQANCPSLPVLMLTASTDSSDVVESLSLGARGYLVKPFAPRQLLLAVEQVVQGGCALGSDAHRILVEHVQRFGPAVTAPALTSREREVLLSLTRGEPTKHLASRLGIAEPTCYRHLANIYKKLGVHTREEACRVFLAAERRQSSPARPPSA